MTTSKPTIPQVPEEFLSHEVPRGALFAWDVIGKLFVGRVLGMREQKGKNDGSYFVVDAVTDDGEQVVFSAGKILAGQLAGIGKDQRVCVQYVGKTRTAQGTEANDFRVYAKPSGA